MIKGIRFGEKYRIESLDGLNVVVKKFVPYKEIKQKDGSIKSIEEHWDNISYHANLKQAIKSITTREVNLIVSDGAQAVIDKLNEIERIIDDLEISLFED